MKPIVSIVIACFNGERHIRQVVESVFNSTSQDFELIVVDDCSTDATPHILASFGFSEKYQLITNTVNKGPAASRNRGAMHAQGEYLFFLDMDAYLKNTAVSSIIASFKKDPAMGGFQAHIINAYTKKTESLGHYLTVFGFPYEIQSRELLPEGNYIFGAKTAGFGIRSEIFRFIQGFDDDYFIHGEDTDLAWRVWLAGYTMKCLPDVEIYHYAKGSLTNKTQYRIYYGGARNGTINILKNASLRSIAPLLILHTLTWIGIAMKLLAKRRGYLAWTIFLGLWWNLTHLSNVFKRRSSVWQWATPHQQLNSILFGRISPQELIIKGVRWIRSS